MISLPLSDALLLLQALPPPLLLTPEEGAAWDRLEAEVRKAMLVEPNPIPVPVAVDFDEEEG